MRGSERDRWFAGAALLWSAVALVAFVGVFVRPAPARAQVDPVQYFYVSIPEEEFRTYANAQTVSGDEEHSGTG